MKKKLTVTVDADLIPRAKQYAPSCGVSLLSIVEASLRAVAGECIPSFSSRWRGQFEPAKRNDPLYDALARKYL